VTLYDPKSVDPAGSPVNEVHGRDYADVPRTIRQPYGCRSTRDIDCRFDRKRVLAEVVPKEPGPRFAVWVKGILLDEEDSRIKRTAKADRPDCPCGLRCHSHVKPRNPVVINPIPPLGNVGWLVLKLEEYGNEIGRRSQAPHAAATF